MRYSALKNLAILLAVSVSLSAATATGQSAAGKFRTITVVSEPEAIVWIDDVRYGRTDKSGVLAIKTVSPGVHTIRVRAAGFKEKSQPLTAVQKGEVKVTLVKTSDEAELAYQEAERLTSSDREKSAAAYRRAISLRPKYVEAQLGLGRVLQEAGEFEEALNAITAAKKLRPAYAEASAVEGRIHQGNGEENKAIAAFKRAITEGKGFQPEAYTGLGLLYKEKAERSASALDFDAETANYTEAAKYLKQAQKQLAGAPDAIYIYEFLGPGIYEKQKRYTEAMALYEEFLRIFPDANEATSYRSYIVQIKKLMAEQD